MIRKLIKEEETHPAKQNIIEKTIRIKNRELVVPKSCRKLISLVKKHPYLLKEASDFGDLILPTLCENVEMNFIQALLLKQYPERYIDFFKTNLGFKPERLLKPVEIKRNVEFQVLNEKTGSFKKYKAKKVIVKYAFGSMTGIVISSDYSGLVLNFGNKYCEEYNKLPIADKILSEKMSAITHVPFYPLLLSGEEFVILDQFDSEELANITMNYPRDITVKYLQDNPSTSTLVEHITHLLKILGLINQNEFLAYSKSIKK